MFIRKPLDDNLKKSHYMIKICCRNPFPVEIQFPCLILSMQMGTFGFQPLFRSCVAPSTEYDNTLISTQHKTS